MSRPSSSHPELDAVLHLLGTVSDQDVADKVGLSASVVGRHRRRLGIKAYEGYKFAPKSESAEPAGVEAEPVVAAAEPEVVPVAEPEVAPAPVVEAPAEPVAEPVAAAEPEAESAPAEGRSKLTPFQHLIGQRPDREVAELANVTVEAVRMFRKRRGIKVGAPEAEAPAKKAKVPGRRRSALDPHINLIGKMSDAEVAALAGVTPENVRAFRNRHGIAASYRGSAAPAPAPAPAARPAAVAPVVAPAAAPAAPARAAAKAAAPAASATTDAWSLRSSSGAVYVVLAEGVVAAANEAAARLGAVEPGATVVAIDRIGVALR